jgi:flagellar biosynthesis protein FlhF
MSSERRYRGRTPGEAMRKARQELGEDARLLGARRVTPPGVTPLYEVRVTPGVAARRDEDDAIVELRRELAALRASIGALRADPIPAPPLPAASAPAPAASDVDAPGAPDTLAALLRRRGVGETLARSLAERARGAGEPDAIAGLTRALAETLAAPGRLGDLGRGSTVVVGPAGGGKTTTLAKIAADAVARGGAPVLVCADGESLAGEDALASVAAALGLEFETAFLDGQLEDVIERRGRHVAYLVDTPGRVPDEPGGIESLGALVRALPSADVLLVAPAATEDEELRRLVQGFAPLGVERLVLTKLDELARPGRLVELASTLPRPIAWVTFGRSARGAGSTPDDPRVIARLLGTSLAVERTA